MQERNFEKQVKQKMEELSLTPSEPVWKKVEEQIRKKRDRRRLLFWLPLIALLLAGGIWLFTNSTNSKSLAEVKKAQKINAEKINTTSGTQSATKEDKEIPITGQNRQPDKSIEDAPEQKDPTSETALEESQFSTRKNIYSETPHKKRVTNILSGKKALETTENNSDEVKHLQLNSAVSKPEASDDKQTEEKDKIKETQSLDTIINNIASEPGNQKNTDSTTEEKQDIKTDDKDSVTTPDPIAKSSKNDHSKWKFGIQSGLARSGVNNGVDIFGGGAKSLETNAFADTRSYTYSLPSNSNAPFVPKPPSQQKKSFSFSLGLLVKKQIGKRSSLSTGLQYNFYSTQMLVGQNLKGDTMVDQNKSVNSFYANSGSSFHTYHNKFHFISLPIALDLQLLKQKPLDFHLGLSLQQLVGTNALLYSAHSQIYYQDKNAFNKTYLFSELGLEYSFPLGKNLTLQTGPRATYSHSRVIKESSGRHLFSYGLATQFIFSGK